VGSRDGDKAYTVYLPKELLKKFKIYCIENEASYTKEVIKLLVEYMEKVTKEK